MLSIAHAALLLMLMSSVLDAQPINERNVERESLVGGVQEKLAEAVKRIENLEYNFTSYISHTEDKFRSVENKIDLQIQIVEDKISDAKEEALENLREVKKELHSEVMGVKKMVRYFHPPTTIPPTTTATPERSTTPEPVITTPEPVLTTAEPVITTPEPVITTPEPVITTAEPVITTPEPIITTGTKGPVTTTTEAPGPYVYYPPGTHDHRAPITFKKYNLNFQGFGTFEYQQSFSQNVVKSFNECVSICVKKRSKGGRAWNGVQFRFMTGVCLCVRHDHGHVKTKSDLHYKFE